MNLVHPDKWHPQGFVDLEKRAWEALRQTERSVLVTAGAGAGKTEFLAQKATYLLQTNLCPAPKRILAISFKRDASRNLAERVAMRCPSEQSQRLNSYTFDAFTKSLVDRFRVAIPEPYCPPNKYRIVMPRKQDYNNFLDTHNFYHMTAQQLEREIANRRLPSINENLDLPREVDRYWRTQYDDHGEAKLSFPMLNRLAELLIRENPSILKALHLTYPAVFLDEFQDTTEAQFQLLRTAFDDSKTIFTAVGDDKQRIMVWAGAMPNAFDQFEQQFDAQKISLICNWRSHEDLVRIQHVIASRIDSNADEPEARADRNVDGDIAAIWEFSSEDGESKYLAQWIEYEVQTGNVEPQDFTILVRMRADEAEDKLTSAFAARGLRLRNVARNVGDISIQDLLGEDLTQIFLRLIRLCTTKRSPENWNTALLDLQFLEGVGPTDEMRQQVLRERFQKFLHEMQHTLRRVNPTSDSVDNTVQAVCDFIGTEILRQAFPSYQRQPDFDRVRNGFRLLMHECLQHSNTWSGILDEFEGLGQITLMTIHKSKGLEFHTMIFYGLDNQTWWSLKPNCTEELRSFFVALTRAKQRAFFTLCTERGRPVTWIENLLCPAGVHRITVS